MSALTKRYLPTLRKINRLAEKQKHQLMKNCDRSLVECFSECAKKCIKTPRTAESVSVCKAATQQDTSQNTCKETYFSAVEMKDSSAWGVSGIPAIAGAQCSGRVAFKQCNTLENSPLLTNSIANSRDCNDLSTPSHARRRA